MPTINDILGLIGGERYGDDGRFNMASETQTDCHNYSLVGTSTCTPDLSDQTLYVEVPAFQPIEYVKTERAIDAGDGSEETIYRRIEPQVRFFISGNQELFNKLARLALHETITFTNLPDSVAAVVYKMEVAATELDSHLRIEITMLFADSAIITKLCCGSYYDNAPFDECDGDGETGDPNNDPDCSAYEVAITFSEGPPAELTAASMDAPAGTETFTWYLDGELFGTGATIQPVLPGVYTVQAAAGNCTATASYTYSGDCGGYDVTIQTVTTGDGGTILIALANLVSTFQWQLFNDPNWEDITGETGMVFEPEADGEYRVVAETTGGCEATSDSVEVTLPTVCTDLFTLNLTNVDGTLTVEIIDYAGAGTPAYEWVVDTGEGLQTSGFTGATIPGAEPGYWIVNVTIDGCTVSAGLLVQCTPAGGGGSDCSGDLFQEFAGSGSNYEFSVTNFTLPDPAFLSEVQIESILIVDRQGLKLRFNPGTPAAINEYTIDYNAQQIILSTDFPLELGDTLGVLKIPRI